MWLPADFRMTSRPSHYNHYLPIFPEMSFIYLLANQFILFLSCVQNTWFLALHRFPLVQLPNHRLSSLTPVTVEHVRARFDYQPKQSDELELRVDDLIQILDRNLPDEGWWKGKNLTTKKIGVFPDNFVVPVAETEGDVVDRAQVRFPSLYRCIVTKWGWTKTDRTVTDTCCYV
ncbi:unnamed protein product [Echinostoma caproni]|uniref:SH3 domain-containing protein n=1 Tax=Echinostoma caproni TaxID=27848 RepID=A0A3P8GXL7_9TREM|nr:unnamed protein product [Echinostoma caproni]